MYLNERRFGSAILTMFRPLHLLILLSLFQFSMAAEPIVINDSALSRDLGKKIGELVDASKTTGAKELIEQLSRKSTALALAKPSDKVSTDIYSQCVDSVGIIASVYKCGKCDKWHRSGCATCWILSEDGVMVTNYHVFENAKHSGWGVLLRDGRVCAVKEVLAADKSADIAIFRVEGEGFNALKLGEPQKVGGEAHIIAHPDSRFFTYTAGVVSRYYAARTSKTAKTIWMAVTAEFARGSSGGPVLDECGNVVGMVANTQSIYYPKKKESDSRGPFQMVIRNCVRVADIQNLIEAK
jgi:serine protease Do